MKTEHQEQTELFKWAEENKEEYPVLDSLFAIPNGSHKSIATAMKFKREGLKSGVPDVCLPIASSGYSALYIEMKVKGKKTFENQDKWIEKLRKQGNKVAVCYTSEEAIELITEYIHL